MVCVECGKDYEGRFCDDCFFQCQKCGEILDKVIFESLETIGFCYECIEESSESFIRKNAAI